MQRRPGTRGHGPARRPRARPSARRACSRARRPSPTRGTRRCRPHLLAPRRSILSPAPADPSSFTVVPSAAQCAGGCTRSAAALDAKPQRAARAEPQTIGVKLATDDDGAKGGGRGTKCESIAPCIPSACHREILSLHDNVTPGTFSASRSRANTTPGAGACSPRPAAPLTVVTGLLGGEDAGFVPRRHADHSSFHVTSSTSLIANDASGLDAPPAIAGMEHDPHGAVET